MIRSYVLKLIFRISKYVYEINKYLCINRYRFKNVIILKSSWNILYELCVFELIVFPKQTTYINLLIFANGSVRTIIITIFQRYSIRYNIINCVRTTWFPSSSYMTLWKHDIIRVSRKTEPRVSPPPQSLRIAAYGCTRIFILHS